MNEKDMALVFSSSFDQWTEYNSSFDKGVLRVCYVGNNRNGTSISKEAVEASIRSIYNCPIVCRYDREADELGSHDMELVRGADGDLKIVNMTHPVGVIPESARYWWSNVTEEDGTTHEYLFVEALLWKRQEAYQKIKDEGVTEQSMEITIKEGSDRNGIYAIERFEFTAFCLLGTAEPCFESAALMTFATDTFREQMREMMQEFKQFIAEPENEMRPSEEDGIDDSTLEGGNEALNEFIDQVVDEIVNPVTDPVEEPVVDPVEEPAPQTETVEVAEQFALAEQVRSELIRVLDTEQIETCFGMMSRYWYRDYDSELSEVYCYDYTDWLLYGFSYSVEGDAISIDFETKKRMKEAIVPFEGGEESNPFGAAFELAAQKYGEQMNSLEEYRVAAEQVAEMQNELTELRNYRNGIEQATATQARQDVLDQFAELAGNEMYDQLVGDMEQYSPEQLEEKCYAIKGRMQSAKFALSEAPKAPKLPVEKTVVEDGGKSNEPYGGVFTKYGIG